MKQDNQKENVRPGRQGKNEERGFKDFKNINI